MIFQIRQQVKSKMENTIKLIAILFCCSCTYFNFKEIDTAKSEVKKKCESEVKSNVISSCQKGVDNFAYAGLMSPEYTGNEEKIRAQIEEFRHKASEKCDAIYGDDDRALIACDIGVELAAAKAREMFLQARVGESSSTDELAIVEYQEEIEPTESFFGDEIHFMIPSSSEEIKARDI